MKKIKKTPAILYSVFSRSQFRLFIKLVTGNMIALLIYEFSADLKSYLINFTIALIIALLLPIKRLC